MKLNPIYMSCMRETKWLIWIGTGVAAWNAWLQPEAMQLSNLAGWTLAVLCRAAYDIRTDQMAAVAEAVIGGLDGQSDDHKDPE